MDEILVEALVATLCEEFSATKTQDEVKSVGKRIIALDEVVDWTDVQLDCMCGWEARAMGKAGGK